MESYLIYIAKSALAAAAFYLVYLLLFQNRKQFVFNRIYLPVSLALSFIIPLITFTTVKYIEPAPATETINSFAYLPGTTAVKETSGFIWEWYHYLLGIYIFTGFGFLLYLLFGHFKALRIVKQSRSKKIFGTEVNITKYDVHPFSFFNKIILSKKTLANPNLKIIVAHENIHVKERHTLDILFTEILFLFQWFNPFAWLIKDAVKNNLEYKTDHEITKTYNPENYQLAMVALADKKGVAPFLTALNGSQLKNRIIMMKQKTENKYALLKQLVVLPLLAFLIMGLSNKEIITEIVQAENKVENTEKITLKGKVTDKNGSPLSNVEIFNRWGNRVGSTNKEGDLSIEAEHDKETFFLVKKGFNPVSYKLNPDKKELKTIIQLKKTETENTKQDSVPLIVEEMPQFPGGELALREYIAKRIIYPKIALEKGIQGTVFVSFIINKKGNVTNAHISKSVDPILDKEALRVVNSLPKWKPGKQRGKAVDVPYTVPVEFVLSLSEIQQNKKYELETPLTPLYIVDGKEIKDINSINSDNIESISVLKNKTSTSLYGEKGKNGVILITMKKEKPFDTSDKTVIVDGKEFDGDINDIPPADIASIEVRKADKMKGIYGGKPDKDKIIINTKTKYNTNTTQPIVVVNGEITDNSFNDIDPESIESMAVLKGEKAISKYGEKGKNGVVEITLKPDKIDTPLKLRKFIAKRVKYPKAAQTDNIEGLSVVIVEFDQKGNVACIYKKPKGIYKIKLDEIVVTTLKNKGKKAGVLNDETIKLLDNETMRILNKLPKVYIEEFKGEKVAVPVKYVLK